MSFYRWVVVVCLVCCSHIGTVLSGLQIANPCPNGAQHNFGSDNGKCFVVRQKLVSRNIGERNCENMGGVLATIDDGIEQNFINSITQYYNYWIGPNDHYNSREYVNADGSNVSYFNWEDGQPDDNININDKQCVQLTDTKKWYDVDCRNPGGYICQLVRPRKLLQLKFINLGESQFTDGEVSTKHTTISRIKCQVLCVSQPVCIGYMWIAEAKVNNCQLILPWIGNSLDVYPDEMIYEVVER